MKIFKLEGFPAGDKIEPMNEKYHRKFKPKLLSLIGSEYEYMIDEVIDNAILKDHGNVEMAFYFKETTVRTLIKNQQWKSPSDIDISSLDSTLQFSMEQTRLPT